MTGAVLTTGAGAAGVCLEVAGGGEEGFAGGDCGGFVCGGFVCGGVVCGGLAPNADSASNATMHDTKNLRITCHLSTSISCCPVQNVTPAMIGHRIAVVQTIELH
jgi:hypothetical protein